MDRPWLTLMSNEKEKEILKFYFPISLRHQLSAVSRLGEPVNRP